MIKYTATETLNFGTMPVHYNSYNKKMNKELNLTKDATHALELRSILKIFHTQFSVTPYKS